MTTPTFNPRKLAREQMRRWALLWRVTRRDDRVIAVHALENAIHAREWARGSR